MNDFVDEALLFSPWSFSIFGLLNLFSFNYLSKIQIKTHSLYQSIYTAIVGDFNGGMKDYVNEALLFSPWSFSVFGFLNLVSFRYLLEIHRSAFSECVF